MGSGKALALGLVMCGLLALPATAYAQVEVTGVIGGLLGGDLNNLLEGTASVKTAFDNGPLYGVRVGWIHGFVGAEGSFVYSPSGVKISAPNRPIELDGRVNYTELNFLVIPIPGPISPFFTIGAGWHSYTLDLNVVNLSTDEVQIQKFGWNFGGGLKINIKGLTLRGEVRDHLTKITPDDFAVADIAADLGFDSEATLHNVEISGGIGIRF